MTYLNQTLLSRDNDFQDRCGACVVEQAKIKNDELASFALQNPPAATQRFMPFIASEPGFADAYETGGQAGITDGQILSAVQGNWDAVAATFAATTVP